MNRDEDYRRHKTEAHQKRQIKLHQAHNITNSNNDLSDKAKGKLRKQSYCDCGTTGCPMCGNARRNKMLKTKDRLTIQEQQFNEKFVHEIDELSNTEE